jgi:hypothetical protein
LYVADTNNCLIKRIEISSGKVTTLAGTALVSGATDGIGASAAFYWPTDLVCLEIDGSAYLVVSDTGNNCLREINLETLEVSLLVGNPAASGFINGAGLAARFDSPRGLAVRGNILLIADGGNAALRSLDLSTLSVSTLADDALGITSLNAVCVYEDMAYLGGAGTLYSYSFADNSFMSIQASGLGTVGGMEPSYGGAYLYVTDESACAISLID